MSSGTAPPQFTPRPPFFQVIFRNGGNNRGVSSPPPDVTGLVCTDDEHLGPAIALLMHTSGVPVFGIARTVDDVLRVVRGAEPHVMVVDITALGARGLRALPALLDAAPGSFLAVVSPFPALAEEALAAGASVVVDRSDLRPLRRVFSTVRTEVHEGYACTCCQPELP